MKSARSAQDLSQSLQRLRGVGLVEETFELMGHEITVRNLKSSEHEKILTECEGLQDAAYVHHYQMTHVCHGIAALGDTDLRDVKFVEVDETDPKTGKSRKAFLEVHTWLAREIVSTWGREAVHTAFRKVLDCIDKAERKARDGVTFLVPDEVPEEKLRRQLGDLIETMADVPDKLIDQALKDVGLIRVSTVQELEAAGQRLEAIQQAQQQAESSQAAPQEPAPVPKPVVREEPEPELVPDPKERQAMTPEQEAEVRALMRNRTPVHQQQATTPQPAQDTSALAKARQAQALALVAERELGLPETPPTLAQDVQEVRPAQPRATLRELPVDQAPIGGLNPRFVRKTLAAWGSWCDHGIRPVSTRAGSV